MRLRLDAGEKKTTADAAIRAMRSDLF